MNPARTKVLACATVMEELEPLLPPGVTAEVLDFGLHNNPARLKTYLQEAIDAAEACGRFDTILLGYGLCSLAVVGLHAPTCTLVMPRLDDCIALFFGSRQAYQAQVLQAPGTYYLTKGWIEVASTPFDEYDDMVAKYGQARADRLMGVMLKHYTRLVYIDTGSADKSAYIAYAQKTAQKFHLTFEEIRGEDTLVRKLAQGPWDDDFLVVPPGHVITFMDFKAADFDEGV